MSIGETVNYTFNFSTDIDESSFTAEDLANAKSADISIGDISETVPGVFTVVITASTSGSLQSVLFHDHQ